MQVGLFYNVGDYTASDGGNATIFTFNVAQYLTGLAVGLPVAAVVGGLVAIFFGSIILGMRGHYFAICTLGLGVAAGQIFAGWEWVGAGSGMSSPNAPAKIGDITRIALLPRLRPGGDHLRGDPLAAHRPASGWRSTPSATTRTRRRPWACRPNASR